MKIAQVAPLYEPVPPPKYGGTERVVSLLSDALIDAGHEVTVYAAGDSTTRGTLRPGCHRAIRDNRGCIDPVGVHYLMLEQVLHEASGFDVIHFHTDFLHFPFVRRLNRPHITTLHGRLDLPHLKSIYREYTDIPTVSISRSQRTYLPEANWVATIYHGLGKNELTIGKGNGGYLAFLGRMSPEKGPDKAIQIARQAGMKIKMAAKVDPVDREYFRSVIEPLLEDDAVEFIGEVDHKGKMELLQGASALLFAIDWPEPFGLVMIEAMACGTPVVAWNRGSVPEVVDEGITGFIVHSDEEAIAAIERCKFLDRMACRARFEQRFLKERMMADYVNLYEVLIESWQPHEAVA
jgi:glycosyltransferase involved in cell wall biosynthesis